MTALHRLLGILLAFTLLQGSPAYASVERGVGATQGQLAQISSILAGDVLGGPTPTTTAGLTTLATAIKAGSATVVFVGDSILEGANQNWLEASVARQIQRQLRAAFPDCAFTFVNLSLGGKKSADFANASFIGGSSDTASTFKRAAQAAGYVTDAWHSPDLSFNGSATSKSWHDHVVDRAPDAVFLQLGLNETSAAAFTTSMQAILTNFQTGVEWTKKPSVILGISHTGTLNAATIRLTARVLRSLARVYKMPLYDAGRVYDLLTTGIDPTTATVSGEAGFRYNGGFAAGAAFAFDTAYWANITGTPVSGGGSTVQETGNGTLITLRKRLASDLRITTKMYAYASTPVYHLYYRADPADLTSTAARYDFQISGTTAQLYWQATGGTRTAVGSAVTISPGVANGTVFSVRVTALGSRHTVELNGKVIIDLDDFSSLADGYAGFGVTNGGQFAVGTNATNGTTLEYFIPVQVGPAPMTDAQLLGAVNDFDTNPDSVGGNAINHLNTGGWLTVYAPVLKPLMRQIQAAVAR